MENKGKIAIVGSGLIGRSWCMLFTSAGYEVYLFDVVPEAVEKAVSAIKDDMKNYEASGLLKGKLSAEEQLGLIRTSRDLKECVAGALYIQECIPEVLDMKKRIFDELDSLVDDKALIASSSSAIPCSQFTENLKHREQCIVAHPVNPPYLMPLVELVPAPWTSPNTVSSARSLMTEIGQSPVTLKKEVPGFIQPRIQYAIIMEALRLVKDGVVSVDGIDKIMTDGLGMRYSFMGPFETAHLNAEGFKSYIERYAEMIYDISSDSGPAIAMNSGTDYMQEVSKQCCDLTPIEALPSKREWRDKRIALLAKIRQDLNKASSSSKEAQ